MLQKLPRSWLHECCMERLVCVVILTWELLHEWFSPKDHECCMERIWNSRFLLLFRNLWPNPDLYLPAFFCTCCSQVFRPILGPFDFGLFTRRGTWTHWLNKTPPDHSTTGGGKRLRNGTKIKLGEIEWSDNLTTLVLPYIWLRTSIYWLSLKVQYLRADSAAADCRLFGEILRKTTLQKSNIDTKKIQEM